MTISSTPIDQVNPADIDLFADDVLTDPFPIYQRLRAEGDVVWSDRHQVWVVLGYREVRKALLDQKTFISGEGIALNPGANMAIKGSVLSSDSPDHERLRGVLNERLSPRGIKELVPTVRAEAERIADNAVAKGSFDAVEEIAQALPVAVVGELIGLPVESKTKLLAWADSMFNAFGPENARTAAAFPDLMDMRTFLYQVTPDMLEPGSFGASIYEAGARGTLSPDDCANLLGAYMGAGLDTTINTIAASLRLFALNPDQWQSLRDEPQLLSNAIDEILRIASPVVGFSRVASADTALGEKSIEKGQRVLLLYAAANRDPKKYEQPDVFDIRRRASDHLSFGIGRHHCAGQLLARLEIEEMLRALLDRVERIETDAPMPHLNNVILGFEKMPTRLVAASGVATPAG